MADYSTEFDDAIGDFSIKEEFANLEPGNYVPCMCEGFGFSYLKKDIDGKEWVGFVNYKESVVANQLIHWVEFKDLTFDTIKTVFK